jgi:epoxyqueuosine reductase
MARLDLEALLFLDEEKFEADFGDTALRRTRRQGLVRNAAIALGNRGDTDSLKALEQSMSIETDPVILEACGWARDCIERRRRDRDPG